jgi:phage gpG-like protein
MPIYGLNKLDKRIEKLGKALQRSIPRRIGQDAENHFRASFKNGGFTNRTLVKWRPRKQQPIDRRGKVKAHTVLFQHGLLRGSVRLVQADSNNIQVVAGGPHVPYARIHNEGGWIRRQVTRRAHSRRAHPARMRDRRVLVQATHVRRNRTELVAIRVQPTRTSAPTTIVRTDAARDEEPAILEQLQGIQVANGFTSTRVLGHYPVAVHTIIHRVEAGIDAAILAVEPANGDRRAGKEQSMLHGRGSCSLKQHRPVRPSAHLRERAPA